MARTGERNEDRGIVRLDSFRSIGEVIDGMDWPERPEYHFEEVPLDLDEWSMSVPKAVDDIEKVVRSLGSEIMVERVQGEDAVLLHFGSRAVVVVLPVMGLYVEDDGGRLVLVETQEIIDTNERVAQLAEWAASTSGVPRNRVAGMLWVPECFRLSDPDRSAPFVSTLVAKEVVDMAKAVADTLPLRSNLAGVPEQKPVGRRRSRRRQEAIPEVTDIDADLAKLVDVLEDGGAPDHGLDIRLLSLAERLRGDEATTLRGVAVGPELLALLGEKLSPSQNIHDAGRLFDAMLPGWFLTFGKCNLTGHASAGPDYNGPEHERLVRQFPIDIFDAGIHSDLAPGGDWHRSARAMMSCMLKAIISIRSLS